MESFKFVDEVVIGDNTEEIGFDFIDHFRRIKPDLLVVCDDDKFEKRKREICKEVGAEYIKLPKSKKYKGISSTSMIKKLMVPPFVPLRVDFAGGWLDVPRYAIEGSFIVNCSISPIVSLNNWLYEQKSGIGGSGAYAILNGEDGVKSEVNAGVGWQDPAIVTETGLCVWRSGKKPILEFKQNPDWLKGKMALLWTGEEHDTRGIADKNRDYSLLSTASRQAASAIIEKDLSRLQFAIKTNYGVQLKEGMKELPEIENATMKYCGSGFGGYALYLFNTQTNRDKFLCNKNTLRIEPYMQDFYE